MIPAPIATTTEGVPSQDCNPAVVEREASARVAAAIRRREATTTRRAVAPTTNIEERGEPSSDASGIRTIPRGASARATTLVRFVAFRLGGCPTDASVCGRDN